MKPSDWWRGRERINRELGKIVNGVGVGVFPQGVGEGEMEGVQAKGRIYGEVLKYALSIVNANL